MKLLIPESLQDANIPDLLIKASEEIEKYEFSDFLFVKEYQQALIRYVEKVIEGIADGLALKLQLDPTEIRKSIRLPYDTLLKAADGEEIDNSLFYKSIFDKLKKKYSGDIDFFKKFQFNKGAPLKPIQFKGRVTFNPETKELLTNKEWDQISKDIEDYLGDTLEDLDDKVLVRAGLMGLLQKKIDEEGITPAQAKKKSYDDIQKQFGEITDSKARKEIEKGKQTKLAIEWAKDHAAEHLSLKDGKLKNQIIHSVRNQITAGLQDGLNAKQLMARLYKMDPEDELGQRVKKDTLDAWKRDWRRVAITEFNTAMNNAYMAAHVDEAGRNEKVYFIYNGRYNPKEKNESCNKFLGKTVLWVDDARGSDRPAKNEKHADFLVWQGKDNVGRSRKNQWICIPTHPHCTHYWTRFYPSFQEWNPDMKKIQYKIQKSQDVGILDLIKNDPTQDTLDYKKVKINIEWPKGSTREYPGSPYKNKMHADYGYIRNTDSPDGEEVDVYVSSPIKKNTIFMLNQMTPDGKYFDEHKFMIGFKNKRKAIECYQKTMTEKMFGGIVELTWKKFKEDLDSFYRKKRK